MSIRNSIPHGIRYDYDDMICQQKSTIESNALAAAAAAPNKIISTFIVRKLPTNFPIVIDVQIRWQPSIAMQPINQLNKYPFSDKANSVSFEWA